MTAARETEIRRRVQAGARARRNVKGEMGDRNISRKLKGKVLSSCITPAYLDGLQTVVIIEKTASLRE